MFQFQSWNDEPGDEPSDAPGYEPLNEPGYVAVLPATTSRLARGTEGAGIRVSRAHATKNPPTH